MVTSIIITVAITTITIITTTTTTTITMKAVNLSMNPFYWNVDLHDVVAIAVIFISFMAIEAIISRLCFHFQSCLLNQYLFNFFRAFLYVVLFYFPYETNYY